MIDPQFHSPEHLNDPYLGAWYAPGVITQDEASAVINEVESSGSVEPIWDLPNRSVNQIFRRLLIDLTREHDFPRVEALGQRLAKFAISAAGGAFPRLKDFSVDEAAVQIYPASTTLPLGWHKDHKNDKLMVISATLAGSGDISFTEKVPYSDATTDDIVAQISTEPLSAVFFRANGLYERVDGTDIRVAHAVTSIGDQDDRFTVQYRMGVNAGAYGNTHVNINRPLR
jgi:hypothetical protein